MASFNCSKLLTVCLCVGLSLAGQGSAAPQPITLRDVCANRQVPLTSVSQVQRLISELRKHPERCDESYVESFYALEPILRFQKGDKICGEAKFEQIARYHFDFVNPKQEVYQTGDDLSNVPKKIVKQPLHVEKFDYTVQLDDYDQEIMIPIALQQFFKAWALQVSGLCKQSLVENLGRAIQTLMKPADEALIGQVVKSSGDSLPSSKALSKFDFSSVYYMPELEGEPADGKMGFSKEGVELDFSGDPLMNQFMHSCLKRFRPIYSRLITPVVRLAKLGYDYVGHKIDPISAKFKQDPDMQRWLAVTSLCEAYGKYELVGGEVLELEEISYSPQVSPKMEDALWIQGSAGLRKELNNIAGIRSSGFQRVMFELGVGGRKVAAFIDPHQSAWYRRNQNTLSSCLNTMSILANAFSIAVTMAG